MFRARLRGLASAWTSTATLAGVVGTLALATLAGCAPPKHELPAGVLVVSQEQLSSWVRNFNPLTPAAASRWPTLAGVYEPMFVFNSIKSEQVPWLAVKYEWLDGNRTLRVTTRDSVLWSDGKPFSAKDVEFTFRLTKRFPGLDRRGVWGFLSGVTARDARTVDFTFQRVFIPGFDRTTGRRASPRSPRCASPRIRPTTARTSRSCSTRSSGRATSFPRSSACS